MSVSLTNFPEGIKNEHAERGKPRVAPPVRFVPNKKQSTTGLRSITIDVTKDQKEKHPLYRHTDVEGLLCFKRTYDHLARKKEYVKSWNENKKKIDEKKDLSSDAAKEAIKELRSSSRNVIDSAFQLYGSLLDNSLASEWDSIVEDICHKPGTNKKGAPTAAKGQTWATLAECRKKRLAKYCPKDSAEVKHCTLGVS